MKKILLVSLLFLTPSLLHAAISENAVWEYRTTGDNNNGGGFVTGSGGTDYSQQDSAEITLTDLAMNAGTTTLTSATGGFTSEMVGNIIHITSGTNFETADFDRQFYEITGHTDTNTITIDADATNGSNASGGTGRIGGALASFTDNHIDFGVTDGNIIWVETGTYSSATVFASSSTGASGSSTAPIRLIGYNTTRGDAPQLDDRPLISTGGNQFAVQSWWIWENIRIVSSSSSIGPTQNNFIGRNIKIHNNSGTGGREALGSADNVYLFGCDLSSDNGDAVFGGFRDNREFIGCYIHDSVDGIQDTDSAGLTVIDSVIANNSGYGIRRTTGDKSSVTILNTTFYGNGTAIGNDDASDHTIYNNIFDSNTTGLSWTSDLSGDYYPRIDWNIWNNNGTDVTNVSKGDNAQTLDVGLVDPANEDFTLGTAGKSAAWPYPHTADFENHLDPGGVQREETGGGGSSEHAFTFIG